MCRLQFVAEYDQRPVIHHENQAAGMAKPHAEGSAIGANSETHDVLKGIRTPVDALDCERLRIAARNQECDEAVRIRNLRCPGRRESKFIEIYETPLRHDLVREPGAGKPHARFDERGEETWLW